jgi:hypothetical protein
MCRPVYVQLLMKIADDSSKSTVDDKCSLLLYAIAEQRLSDAVLMLSVQPHCYKIRSQ